MRLQDELPNLLVLRSLAKSHGLAGARVGYLVVPDGLAERFDAVRLPLSVGAPSEALALAALAADDEARERRRAVIAARDRLDAALRGLGCETLPSVTNFVAFRPTVRRRRGRRRRCWRAASAVRRYEAGPMAGWLRATARLGAEEERLIAGIAGGAVMTRIGTAERTTAETDHPGPRRPRRDRARHGRDADRLPRPPADPVRAPRADRPRGPRQRRRRRWTSTTPWRTRRSSSAARSMPRSASASGSDATATCDCRWTRPWPCARSTSGDGRTPTSSRGRIR